MEENQGELGLEPQVVVSERTGVTIMTAWVNAQTGEVRLHQLSDYLDDGTEDEQIAQIAATEQYAGFSCVSRNFTGAVPDADQSLWRWSDGEVTAAPAPKVVPVSITRRQCARSMFAMGLISGSEAVAMTRNGTPPAMVQAYLDLLPEEERFLAEMDFAADNYYRSNQLLNQIMTAAGHDSDAVDDFFIAAALV